MRKIEQISIGATDRERLERLVRDRNTPQKVVWRARIVLLAADGLTAIAISAAVGKSVLAVRRWRRRYMAKGVDGLLKDATRPSRVKPLTPEKIKQVVHMTLHEKPPNATQWSLRSMAAAAGVSYSSVQADLACARTETASGQDIQGFARSQFCDQGGGRGRALSQSSRQGAGPLRR
jgi:transposase